MMVAHLKLPTGNSLRIVRGTVKELTDACASAMAWDHDTAKDYVIRNQIVKDEPLERTGRRYSRGPKPWCASRATRSMVIPFRTQWPGCA